MKIKRLFTLSLLLALSSQAQFIDKTKQSGIDFVHHNGMTGQFHMIEVIGSGAAFFDYDNDGDMDLYLVQNGELPNSKSPRTQYLDRLYRNDTVKKDTPIFVDVTKQAKINAGAYGMGVATGDLNNDGYVDIFLANYGANQILMNNGDGTFKKPVTIVKEADNKWSVSASIVDQNLDGYLDIYVANYVEYPLNKFIKKCKAYDGSLDYCSPQAFQYQSDEFYNNNKNGTFTNISSKTGLTNVNAAGLGVVSADFNNDSRPDFYVANDGVENHFWINKGNDEFIEFALASGVAVNMNGEPEASMGVDAADFDNDGDIDLFMTHLNRQTNTLYVNNGKGWFSDLTVRMKLGSSSFSYTGFGTLWFDYDNDGLLDLFSANGAIAKMEEQMRNKDPFPFKQSNQIWKNLGKGQYKETTQEQDASFHIKAVSRGAAFADIDNDGDLDVLVTNNNGVPQLLINQLPKSNWLGVKVINPENNRTEIGALVTLTKNDKTYYKRVKTDGSFESSHDDRVVFGLAGDKSQVKIKVRWTDGTETLHNKLAINKYHTIKKPKK